MDDFRKLKAMLGSMPADTQNATKAAAAGSNPRAGANAGGSGAKKGRVKIAAR